MRRNPAAAQASSLLLHGEDLELVSVRIDGVDAPADRYELSNEGLRLIDPPESFTLDTEVCIKPSANTRFEGLYQSGAFLLTQCEAEGFRRITYFLDRPDVMSRFSVRLTADASRFPVLLSNGDDVSRTTHDDGRHAVEWHDPWPKPSYLFALVAGQLGYIEDHFRTMENRNVRLRIYAEDRALPRAHFAMNALKASMRWDEDTYGLAYDLDQFNIVATYDFNMGAMENKSLNVFNAKAIVADLERATDADLTYVEAVVAHEYFHNWTGNRVTCRDWFQLSLKEGLTVYRDQEFSADQGSRAVKRIDDVRQLRTTQFPEDSGPFAHPVRPAEYVEINNFYTATVYDKGAEIVRLYERLLGKDGFRRGMDLYFQRHDGQAVTTDDFRNAMADANGRDLSSMARWYTQAGTPVVTATEQFDPARGVLTIDLTQHTPDTPGQTNKLPVPIPVPIALYDTAGQRLPIRRRGEANASRVHDVLFDTESVSLEFDGLAEKPIVSLLHGFSAPVQLRHTQDNTALAIRLAHDDDAFCRYEAAQSIGERLIHSVYDGTPLASITDLDQLGSAWETLLARTDLDPALVAECLNLPDESWLGESIDALDPVRLYEARRTVERWLGAQLAAGLARLHSLLDQDAGGGFDARATAARRLRHRALALRMAARAEGADQDTWALCKSARNMTERLAALSLLIQNDHAESANELARFFGEYGDDPLLIDKWLVLQAADARPGAASRLRVLMQHPSYTHRNPNKVRSLIGTFGRLNRTGFHAADGSGYAVFAEALQAVDTLNPQVAARLAAAFNGWRRIEAKRQALMRATLERLASAGLSKDSSEIIGKALSG